MKQNENIEIVTVQNGILVRPIPPQHCMTLDQDCCVFESMDSFIEYMKNHFTEPLVAVPHKCPPTPVVKAAKE